MSEKQSIFVVLIDGEIFAVKSTWIAARRYAMKWMNAHSGIIKSSWRKGEELWFARYNRFFWREYYSEHLTEAWECEVFIQKWEIGEEESLVIEGLNLRNYDFVFEK
jgi:hypothetical protein